MQNKTIMSSKTITAIDLFCGAGGFTLAARRIGIKVVAALEISKHACNTYRANFTEDAPILVEQDILQISPSEFGLLTSVSPNTIDILMGGPPCQGYSTHRIKNEGVGDPRNDLLIRYFEFINYLSPSAFIVENVPGMLWPRHKDYIDKFYKLAEKAGYFVAPPVALNACDYGVPQNRRRIFIVGMKTPIPGEVWPPKPTHFSPTNDSVLFEKRRKWINAEFVFKNKPRANDPNNIHMNHSQELIRVFASTPINGGSRSQSDRILPCHKQHNGHKDVYGRIDPQRPGPTMTTACTNPSKGRFLHPTENHGITVRHAARFQTFPDTFIFYGGLMEASRQVGNAVPVLLAEHVLNSVVEAIGY